MKKSLNIGLSSMKCWLYLNGDMSKPIRCYANADCDICIGEVKQTFDKNGKCDGESWGDFKAVEYNPNHVVKLRTGWDGFTDEKYYGKIICKEGESVFL